MVDFGNTSGLDKSSGWKPGDPVGYIRPKIPDFDVPAYRGERYEAMVPDTLDLQDRAALGVNVLTSATDPLADYEIYFWVRFLSNPVSMRHDYNDQCQSKFMEALPLMRIASGSDLNMDVDRRWMEVALHQQGPDGLAYWPTKGRPWAHLGIEHLVPPGSGRSAEHHITPTYIGRLLSALTLYHLRDGGPLWKESAERMVDGLIDLAVDRGRYSYFSPFPIWAETGSTVDGAKRSSLQAAASTIAVLGLTHVYKQTGYEPAMQLGEKLVRYVLDEVRYFDGEGRFMRDEPGDSGLGQQAHFHEHTRDLQAFLEYAQVTGDSSLLELVPKGYEYAKAHGNELLGYFPEFVDSPQLEHSELCGVADMVALGLKITDAGLGDYWDDVDRWVRNMFAEGQLTRAEWINRLHLASDPEKSDEVDVPESLIGFNDTIEQVAERNVGAFAGYPKANDWWPGSGMGTMHCCTGNGTRAIYYVWDHMLTHQDGKLRVNLLLNRASPWADVDSHIPYTGQVDVKIKQPIDLSIRIPEWVKPTEVRCQVSGAERSLSWDGRYAKVGSIKPGNEATLTFPIHESTEATHVEKETYRIVRKGNEIVNINPPGKYLPLYQRDHYRADTTRWRKIERFVSGETIHW